MATKSRVPDSPRRPLPLARHLQHSSGPLQPNHVTATEWLHPGNSKGSEGQDRVPGTWGDTEVTRTTLTVSLRGMWTMLFPSTYLWGVFLAAPLPFWSQQQGLGVSPSGIIRLSPKHGRFLLTTHYQPLCEGLRGKGGGGTAFWSRASSSGGLHRPPYFSPALQALIAKGDATLLPRGHLHGTALSSGDQWLGGISSGQLERSSRAVL